LLLLTDGEPNINPPGGHIPALRQYKQKHNLACTIHTFGFGYSLDSGLLDELAVEGNGTYSFIPDSSFVGTIFVNSLSNILSTLATNVALSIEPVNGAKFPEGALIGNPSHQTTTTGGFLVPLGSIRYGQSKDLVVRVVPGPKTQPYLVATLTYQDPRSDSKQKKMVVEATLQDGGNEVLVHSYRLYFVDRLRTVTALCKNNINKLEEAKKTIQGLIDQISASPVKNDPFMVDLLKDLEGQTMEALSRGEYFRKWGQHYLPSLMRAHLLQQCNNFKDPGVQHYAGKLFTEIRDKVDEAFCKLPPPKPTHVAGNQTYHPVNMAVYNNVSNGCFDGECTVKMADGQVKRAKEVHKDDLVSSVEGRTAKVVCVVKMECEKGRARMVEMEGGLSITPWHPVRIDKKWCFPNELGKAVDKACPEVYNFVLEKEHVMVINDVECVTLGHGFEGDVVQHEYYGTERVLLDLKNMRGWNEGMVELGTGCAVRNEETGLVCGLREN